MMSRSGLRKDWRVRSNKLSTRAWVMVLKKSTAWTKRRCVESVRLYSSETDQEALAYTGGFHQDYMLVLVPELQGEDGIQQPGLLI